MPAGWRRTWRITRSCWPSTASRHPDFDWDDFLPPIRDMASYQGKLLGIPYRVTASILNYQKQLLADVGFDKAPENWAEFQAAASPPPRQARRIATGSASGGARDRRWSADSRRSCAAMAGGISIRRPGRS